MEAKEQFKRLAIAAGDSVGRYMVNTGNRELGVSGTLSDSEVATVLSWLNSAGYSVILPVDGIYNRSVKLINSKQGGVTHVEADSPESTLSEALYAAVMQLSLGSEVAG